MKNIKTKKIKMKNLLLSALMVIVAQAAFAVQEAKAEIKGLPSSLIDLRGGEYKGKMGKDEIKALVLPDEEKKGAFLIMLYLPERNAGKIMTGEFIPEVNAIGIMPRGLSDSKEELELKSPPEAIMKIANTKKGTKLVITPQANSQILKVPIVLDCYDSDDKILDTNYVGQYIIDKEGFFSREGDPVLTINSNGLVDATLNKSGVQVTGQFRIYKEVEGVIILRGITFNQNMQTNEESQVSATAIFLTDGSKLRLMISSDDRPSALQPVIRLKKK